MPIDPGIIASVALPAPQPQQNALTTLTQIESVKALKDQREALAQERMQQTQKLIQQAKDQAATNSYLQQAGGDLDKAGDLASANGDGHLAAPMYETSAAIRQKRAAAVEAQAKATSANVDVTGKIIGAMGDSLPHYQQGRAALLAVMDPSDQQMVNQIAPANATEADLTGIVNRLNLMQQTGEQRIQRHDANVKALLSGEYARGIAGELADTPIPERQKDLEGMLALVPDAQAKDQLRQKFTPFLGLDPDKMRAMALTTEQRAQLDKPDLQVEPVVQGGKTGFAVINKKDATATPVPGVAPIPSAASITAGQNANPVELKPGTANYRQAQDLADGTLTFQDFQRLHSRAQADAPLRAAIYDLARTLNPNFNPAQFEIGYKFASSPKVQQQVASIKNVESGVSDLLKFSDAAERSGSPLLNAFALKSGNYVIGNKKYTNFKTAVTAFADELSGALGYGSATDMSRDMGFDMTDMAQSPENFKSNLEDVVLPFVARKKASILGQMSVYGESQNKSEGKNTGMFGGKTVKDGDVVYQDGKPYTLHVDAKGNVTSSAGG